MAQPQAQAAGPRPGQMVKEPDKRNAFSNNRLGFLEHAAGGIRRLVLPDGISLAEFREHAIEYLMNFGSLLLPGSLMIVVDESNSRCALYFIKMVIASLSAVTTITLLPIFEHESGDSAEQLQPTDKDHYVARYSNLKGFHVINLRSQSVQYQGLASLDEATRLADQLMRNRPRS